MRYYGKEISGAGGSVEQILTNIVASDGVIIPIDSLDQTMTYNAAGGLLDTVTVSYGGNTYKQTFTYSGSNVTLISQWVKQ